MTPQQPVPHCSAPNQRKDIYSFGSCKTSDVGFKCVLTVTDSFTKYANIFAVSNKEPMWCSQNRSAGIVVWQVYTLMD
jgi:hypothetical protein